MGMGSRAANTVALTETVARDRCPLDRCPTVARPLPDRCPLYSCVLQGMSTIVDDQPAPNPTARPYIRVRATGPHWYAKWSRNGTPIVRALGKAWAEADGNGRFK